MPRGPIGALVFGHYGDRLGRKKLLVLSLLLMGGATFAIGLLPTHATVGTAAPVLLTALRLVQGFALGGEWGGAVLIASALHFAVIPAWGALSDRIGRRPVYLLGAAGVGVWAFPFFALVDAGRFGPLLLAVSVGLVFHGAMYAPQAAFFAEMFATRMRYSGASIGAQFSSVAAGAPAPLIATALLADYDSPTPIVLYVIAAALLTLLAVGVARETRSRDLAAVEGSAVEGSAVAGEGRTAGPDGGASSAVPSGGA